MEELLVDALLFCENLAAEDAYNKRLDEMFLKAPENDDLLYLEWETDIRKSVHYIQGLIDYNNFDIERFGRILMSKLKAIYETLSDIKDFADRAYHLWTDLPGNIQDIEPFLTMCYADDPLSYGDEKQARNFYEYVLNYYKD